MAYYPGGQSGNPGSHFYDDMTATWAKGDLYELYFMKTANDHTAKIISNLKITNQIVMVFIIILIASFLLQFIAPWWVIVIVSFVTCGLLAKTAKIALWSPFFAILLLVDRYSTI